MVRLSIPRVIDLNWINKSNQHYEVRTCTTDLIEIKHECKFELISASTQVRPCDFRTSDIGDLRVKGYN